MMKKKARQTNKLLGVKENSRQAWSGALDHNNIRSLTG